MTALPATTAKKLGLVIDLDTCVGCQACATSCKEWNTRRLFRAAHRPGPLRRRSARRLAQPRARLRGRRGRGEPHRAFPALVPALRGAGLRHRLPDRRLLQARRGRHRAGRSRHLHRLQAVLLGLPLRRARVRLRRRRDEEMHAVRRPHLQRDLRREDRMPACVRACPTGARHFGDLGDPDSAVSQLVAERGGFDLLPEFGYKPVNKYLPPRPPRRDRDGSGSRGAGSAIACRLGRPHAAGDQRTPMSARPSESADGAPVPPGSDPRAVALSATPCIQPIPSSCSRRPRARAMACSSGLRSCGLLGLVPTERWLGHRRLRAGLRV